MGRDSTRRISRRLLRFGALAVATACVGGSVAQASPNLLFGFTDNAPFTTGTQATGPALALGARGFAYMLVWSHGKTYPTQDEARGLTRAIVASAGARVVLVVRTNGSDTPLTDVARQDFCAYALNTVKRFPTINDVVIGNEANAPYFWRPQYNPDGSSASPGAYETLLARCYDALHGFRPGIDVAAPGTSPHGNDNPYAKDNISHSPVSFIEGIAAAYRKSGRTRRIFDTVVHHPYGDNNAERPFAMHPGPYFVGEGDWNKLVATYQQAFAGTPQAVPGRCLPPGPCVPIWYLEAGFQTLPRPGAYFGPENVLTIPDISGLADSPTPLVTSPAPDQATQLRYALRLAYCQPYVEAVFNFLIKDDANLLGYQSGILWADWRPKGSYAALGSVLSQLAAGKVSCAAPGSPPSLTAQYLGGPPRMVLRWAGSSSAIGVSGYNVYRNGVELGTTLARTYLDSGVTARGKYRYTVRGYDAAGQTGAASAVSVPSASTRAAARAAAARAAAAAAARATRSHSCAPLHVRTGQNAKQRAFGVRIMRGRVSCLKASKTLRTFMTRHRSPKRWRCVLPHGLATWAATCSQGARKQPRVVVRAARMR